MSNLKAFRVGDIDIYAAESAEHALELVNGLHDYYDISDIVEISEQELDYMYPAFDENELVIPGEFESIRQWLSEATEAGWLAGSEY